MTSQQVFLGPQVAHLLRFVLFLLRCCFFSVLFVRFFKSQRSIIEAYHTSSEARPIKLSLAFVFKFLSSFRNLTLLRLALCVLLGHCTRVNGETAVTILTSFIWRHSTQKKKLLSNPKIAPQKKVSLKLEILACHPSVRVNVCMCANLLLFTCLAELASLLELVYHELSISSIASCRPSTPLFDILAPFISCASLLVPFFVCDCSSFCFLVTVHLLYHLQNFKLFSFHLLPQPSNTHTLPPSTNSHLILQACLGMVNKESTSST